MTQKPYLSGQVSVIDAIMNLAIRFLASNPYYLFQIY